MPRPLHILCDLDSIVADLLPVWLAAYNAEFNEHLEVKDVVNWLGQGDPVPVDRSDKLLSLVTGKMIASLDPVPGAVEYLKLLHDQGHTIHIVSAYSPEQPDTAAEKVRWTLRYLPFVSPRMITLMSQKHLIVGDVLVDDRPKTIKAYRAMSHGKDALLCTIAYPYNECVKDLYDCYALDYSKPVDAWEQIYNAIRKRAEQ